MSSGIFHKFLLEEYKKSGKTNVDVVAEKKKHFWDSVHKANDALRSKNYKLATELYHNIVNFINEDPYPDELKLEDEFIYYMKCCYCYSYISDYENNSRELQNSTDLEIILSSLRCSNSKKMLPYYLQLRLDLEKQNLTSAACQCIMIRTNELTHCDIIEDMFKDLLPTVEEMMQLQKETFFKYKISNGGISIATNTETNKTEELIEQKHSEVQTESMQSVNNYVQTETANCTNLEKHSEVQTKSMQSVNNYVQTEVTNCTDLEKHSEVQTASGSSVYKDVQTETTKCTSLEKNSESQTETVKSGNKHTQTEIYGTSQLQVKIDHRYFDAVLEVRRKLIDLEEIHKVNAERLKTKITEIHTKLDHEDNHNNYLLKENYERKLSNCELELSKLRSALELSERTKAAETEKICILQKCLLDQIHDKYIMQKTVVDSLNAKAYFMIAYLTELLQHLNQTTIPDDLSVRREIEFWRTQIAMNNTYTVRLNDVYNDTRADLLQSNGAQIIRDWPRIKTFPREEDTVIYSSFKSVIQHIVKTETALMNMFNSNPNAYYPSTQNFNMAAGHSRSSQNNRLASQNYPLCPPVNQKGLPGPSATPQTLPRVPMVPSSRPATAASAVPTSISATNIPTSSTVPAAGAAQTADVNPSTSVKRKTKSKQMTKVKPINKSVSSLNLCAEDFYSADEATSDVEYYDAPNDEAGTSNAATNDTRVNNVSTSEVTVRNVAANSSTTRNVATNDTTVGGAANTDATSNDFGSRDGAVRNAASSDGGTKYEFSDGACSLLLEPSAEAIAEDMLFKYISDSLPYHTEQEITLALLDVLDKHGGTFTNVSQRTILSGVREYFRVLRQQQEVRKIEIELLNRRLDETCTICFELFKSARIFALPCHHVFHKHCIRRWVSKSALCPICRTPSGPIR